MTNKNRVGLGTFPLVGVFNKISPKDAENVIRHFLDNGGYYIDTAPMYGNGEMEKILGKVLKDYPRDSYYLISKTVYNIDDSGQLFKSGKYEDVVKHIDRSLSRLGVEYLDQLMVHSPDKNVNVDETLKALEKIQSDGKAIDLSVSNVDLDELKKFNQTGKIKYVENRFSYISRSIDIQFEEYLISNNIKLIPYHLLEIGLLTGNALDKDFSLRKDDLRNKLPYWDKVNQQEVFDFVRDELAPISKQLGCTIGQLNMAWAIKQKFIDFIIVGTTKEKYVDINLKSATINLDAVTLELMESKYQNFKNYIEDKYKKSLREFRGLNEKYY